MPIWMVTPDMTDSGDRTLCGIDNDDDMGVEEGGML